MFEVIVSRDRGVYVNRGTQTLTLACYEIGLDGREQWCADQRRFHPTQRFEIDRSLLANGDAAIRAVLPVRRRVERELAAVREDEAASGRTYPRDATIFTVRGIGEEVTGPIEFTLRQAGIDDIRVVSVR